MRRRGPGARGVARGALAWAVPAVASLVTAPGASAAGIVKFVAPVVVDVLGAACA